MDLDVDSFQNASPPGTEGRLLFGTHFEFVVDGRRQCVARVSALWLPPHADVAISAKSMPHYVVVPAKNCASLPKKILSFIPHAFLRQLLLHYATSEVSRWSETRRQRVSELLFEELAENLAQPFRLPSDPRIQKIAQGILGSPEDPRSLEEWGKRVGVSGRHVNRRFRVETGMSFAQWRSHVRVGMAKDLLRTREPLRSIARKLGYTSEGAFIRMFKKVAGVTPRRYLAM